MDETQQLVIETINKNKQAIVFVPSRASAEKTAEDLSKLTNFSFPELEKEVLKAASTPTKQCRRLSHCIKKGIAFHHAGLLQKQKDLIEDEFRNGTIKIICCTPTLAAGLSLPAFRVIIKSLKRFSGQWGMNWIPVLEYLQMAGRAGRPEYEAFGESICIAKNENEKEEIFNRYVSGVPEDIYSKLAVEPVLRMYLLSLISSGIIKDEKSMKDFFAKTFWASQFNDFKELEKIMGKMLNLLKEWGFVTVVKKEDSESENSTEIQTNDVDLKDDFIVASKLIAQKENDKNKENKEKKQLENKLLTSTLLGQRVSQLYLDPLTGKYFLDNLKKFNEEKNVFSLLQMISHTLEIRPLLRIKKKEEEKIQESLIKNYDALLEEEPSVYDLEYSEFMNSIKTALFFEAWINEKDEDYLLEKYDIRPGEIRVKLEIADWLLYAAAELARLESNHYAVKELNKLRIRVKNGVREDLLLLLKIKGIGRKRARKLVLNGIKDLGDLKKMDLTSLSQIVGNALATTIKKQLGEEVKEIPKGTRKGQLSLMKF